MSRFSLLDNLAEELSIPVVEAMAEDMEDQELEAEEAIATGDDKELSPDDIAAILDDDNDDNEVADIDADEEDPGKIADAAIDDDMKTLEALLDDFAAE